MKRRHIHVHQARDIGKSTEELLKIVRDPAANEKDVGAAIQLLVMRGIDPKTGNHVGMIKARSIARTMGESAQS